ncbi:MAG: Re/Si-specific NAD(P)(+) transhydrogenase subunit alpha [Candidatus Eremiobacteraeota bacterium]|nr:Re/Si-specific NAD(P)(+) transhydrogenase subunit alpha [Candidatus Eremiobacteraeota bacterium]MBV8365291.1 Re/Si-specific NAD(P)(+) transhydrogenase subunit alpha [Candidatus Eremiobacteraeota bacterium]
MNIAVPKEIAPGERRVALTPDVAGRLVKAGTSVVVERGAGEAAGFRDQDYTAAGATIAPTAAEAYRAAGIVVKVQRPLAEGTDELALIPEGAALVAFLQPLSDPQYATNLAQHKITGLAMELIPRISRAQSMDALSSQATVAGYKAVLIAADALPKFFPMLMTAAGTIPPAKVLVLGAGVAGLQAIATARRLGAVVTGFDVRAVVKEQVESLGATFLGSPPQDAEGSGGYAKELAADQQRRDQELIATTAAGMDVIITTALIPGRPAPRLITAAAVQNMRPGSVIVDLAAEAGGNCELSEPGSTVVKQGVTIAAPLNLASAMPQHASMLYAKNLLALLTPMIKDGALTLDMNDEITRGVCVTRDGEVVNEAVRSRLQGVSA